MNKNLKVIANQYKKFGFNVSCILNRKNDFTSHAQSYFKSPSHKWTHLFYKEQTVSEFENYDWNNSVGIGTFTSWNDLIVIDIDGCTDLNILKEILICLDLPENYEWVVESGSKNGYHIYIRGYKIEECDDIVVSTFPPIDRFEKYIDKIEFLWKTHVVLPPSVHGSGNGYSFVNKSFPTSIPLFVDEHNIYNFIETFLDFEEVEGGSGYGDVFTTISSKAEFINDFEEVDLTKYLLDETYLIIDIETSGLPNKTRFETTYPEIIQMSWVVTNKDGMILKKNSFIIDTDFINMTNQSNLINIDFEIARKVKFPISHVFKKLVEDIKMTDYIVAHNIEFDIEILTHYFIKNYGANPFKNKKKICTMKSTVNFCKIPGNYGYKYPKLWELYFKLFDYEISNSHNAETDVLHTLKCFKKLKTLGKI